VKITRIVNGTIMEFELTPRELEHAYREQQHNYDVEDVRSYHAEAAEDNEWRELTDDEIERAAEYSRDYQDSNDDMSESLWNCVHDAIMRVL